MKNQMRDKQSLATDAIHVEQDILKEAVGAQDQVSAAYGGFNRINFNHRRCVSKSSASSRPGRLEELENNLALFFTRILTDSFRDRDEQVKITPHKKKELQMMQQLVGEAQSIVTSPIVHSTNSAS